MGFDDRTDRRGHRKLGGAAGIGGDGSNGGDVLVLYQSANLPAPVTASSKGGDAGNGKSRGTGCHVSVPARHRQPNKNATASVARCRTILSFIYCKSFAR